MAENRASLPKAMESLEIVPVADGYVVHDADRGRIHYLNPTGALVLELCNGEVTEREIAELVQLAYELSEPPVSEVENCVENLRNEGLVA